MNLYDETDCLPHVKPAPLSGWQPIESAPRKRGERVIGWCVFPAGAEAREIKCFIPLDRPNADPIWFYDSVRQTVTHWMPLPAPPVADAVLREAGE